MPRPADRRPRRPLALLATLAALAACTAYADPSLTALAPADTVLAAHLGAGGAPHPGLGADLADLEVPATLAAVLRPIAAADDADLAAAASAALALVEGGPLAADGPVARACPALTDGPALAMEEGLVSLAMRPGAPLPALTLFARSADADAAAARAAALADCFGGGTALRQDGVAIVGLELPGGARWFLARSDRLLIAADDPDRVRAALRRLAGSAEPSLASTPLGRSPALAGDGAGLAARPAAVADLLQRLPAGALGGAAGGGVGRAAAALRTVPTVAVRIRNTPQGLELRSWAAIDAAGGDAGLAAVLRCDGCRARPSLLVPADAWSVTASPWPLRGWIRWIRAVVTDASRDGGDPLVALEAQTGLDLERDLTSWIGERITTASLPPVRTGMPGLLGAPAQITLVPVVSEDAAWAGLERIARALAPALDGLPEELGGTDGDRASMIAIRERRVEGVRTVRLQVGPATDLGLAVVRNHLVLARPAAALDAVLATSRGAPGVFDAPALSAALRDLPGDAQAVEAADLAALLGTWAPAAQALAQPLAFAVTAALVRDGGPPLPLAPTLAALELPGRALAALARHAGVARGATVIRPDGIERTLLVPLH